jgi:microcompartment protein CcmK/EutM
MFAAQVVGTIWSTVKWPKIEGIKLLAVRPLSMADFDDAAAPPDEDGLVVCADLMQAGVGDRVLVAYGHAARVAMHESLAPGQKPAFPVDAAIVAIIEGIQTSGDAGGGI